MTLAEMHIQFDQRMDEANAPWFNAIEKDDRLNRAMEQMVREYYGRFETDERIRQALSRLVEPLGVTFAQTGVVGIANLDALAIPFGQIMFVLSLQLEVTDVQGRTKKRAVKPHLSNDEIQVTNDPFNVPSVREPKLHMEHDGLGDRRLRVYVGGENDVAPFPVIGTANVIRILRSPRRMDSQVTPNVECELPEFVHDDIVNRAVSIGLEEVESARLAGQSNLANQDKS
jgi:hypothetical protein